MSNGPARRSTQNSDPAGWSVWLVSEEMLERSEAGSILSAREGGSACLGVLLALVLLALGVGNATQAIQHGQFRVLLWLVAGHLPLLAWFALLRREWLASKQEPDPPRPPTARPLPALFGSLTEEGIWRQGKLVHPWRTLHESTFEKEDGFGYMLRLRADPEPPEQRYPLRTLAALTPAIVSCASVIVGLVQFGWRQDVAAAVCIAGLHLLLLVPLTLSLRADERRKRARPYRTLYLLFDSRQIPAAEAMERVASHILHAHGT